MSCSTINLVSTNQCTQVIKGVDWGFEWEYLDFEGKPVDITDLVFSGKISGKSEEVLLNMAEVTDPTLSGIQKTDPTNGVLVWRIRDEDSRQIVNGVHSFCIHFVDSDVSKIFARGHIQFEGGC